MKDTKQEENNDSFEDYKQPEQVEQVQDSKHNQADDSFDSFEDPKDIESESVEDVSKPQIIDEEFEEEQISQTETHKPQKLSKPIPASNNSSTLFQMTPLDF